MQYPHVLHVGPLPAPLPERVVGEAEVHGGKQLLAEAVAGEGSRFAHQGADDVAVIDVGFPLAMHPLHPFHLVALVVHFHPVGVQPDLHLLADEAGGHAVAMSRYLDGAPLAHPGLVVDVFRHGSRRQGAQASYLLLQLSLYQAIASLHHLPDKVSVVVGGVKSAAAPQHQGLVGGVLQAVVGVLGDAVFMALARVDAGGAEAIVVQQGGVIVVKRPASAAFHLVSSSRGIVAAQYLGDAAQGPQGILQTLLQRQEGLAGGDLSVAPSRVAEDQLEQQVGVGLSGDGHPPGNCSG